MRSIPHTSIAGFRVRVERGVEGGDWALEKIREAIEVIADYDPHRLARIKRDLRDIYIGDSLGTNALGGYSGGGVCSISAPDLLKEAEGAPIRAAMILVHEATHARLEASGFGPLSYVTRPAHRIRIESICKRQEIAFLSRFPSEIPVGPAVELLEEEITQLPVRYSDSALMSLLRSALGRRDSQTNEEL